MAWGDKDRKGEGGDFEYILTVVNAKYGYTVYNDGKTCLLILSGVKEFSNGKQMDGHLWVPTSFGDVTFEPGDAEGTFAIATNGDRDARFHGRSRVQLFINSALDAGVPLDQRSDSSVDAKGWIGLKFSMVEKEEKARGFEWRQPLVTEYLGEVDVSGITLSEETSAQTPAASSNGRGDLDKAREIAQRTDDFGVYLSTIAKELGITDFSHDVMQQSFYDEARQ